MDSWLFPSGSPTIDASQNFFNRIVLGLFLAELLAPLGAFADVQLLAVQGLTAILGIACCGSTVQSCDAVLPRLPTFGTDTFHLAIQKDSIGIVAPRASQITCYVWFYGDGAIVKDVSIFDALWGSCCCDISITQTMQLTTVEVGGGPTEDEVNRALDIAILVILSQDKMSWHLFGQLLQAFVCLWVSLLSVGIEGVLMSEELALAEDDLVACHQYGNGLTYT